MAQPAPYSSTDTAEGDAVLIFESLLDSKRVKTDIRTRDKYPNIDGYIELVDKDNRPFGKFAIQIRKIGDGKKSYSCPSSLVGYSGVSTLPIILACVDNSSKRAYWRHITYSMPEYKSDQDSFTIRFDDAADSIDIDGTYIQKWTEIIFEYQERIARYPELQLEIANKLTLETLPPGDIRYFQQYVDSINRLFDNEFITIKKIIYPDVWKFGVGIFYASEQSVSFQIYKIPFEKPAPLVCKLERAAFYPISNNPYAIRNVGIGRGNLSDPEISARSFVLDKVKRVVEERMLPIHGKLTSIDILFEFIDRYYKILSLSPERNSFNIEELSFAINKQMLGVCTSIAANISKEKDLFVSLDLDRINDFLFTNPVRSLSPGSVPVRFSVGSRHFPISTVFDALRNLMNLDIHEIERPFARRSQSQIPGDWIWSGYTQADEIRNIALMMERALPEYSEFVSQNGFNFPESKYLGSSTAIISEYEPVSTPKLWPGPILREHHLNNQNHKLPKFTFIILTEGSSPVDVSNFPEIIYKGASYSAILSAHVDASFFFTRTPMLNLLYRMLENDLADRYGIDHFTSSYN